MHTIQGNRINSTMDLNHVFSSFSDKEEIYPLKVSEIAEEQTKDKSQQQLKSTSNVEETLIENTIVLCKNCKMIIPKTLQKRAVAWYHHYLQHPGHSCLEETLKAAMYWKNLRKDVQWTKLILNINGATRLSTIALAMEAKNTYYYFSGDMLLLEV